MEKKITRTEGRKLETLSIPQMFGFSHHQAKQLISLINLITLHTVAFSPSSPVQGWRQRPAEGLTAALRTLTVDYMRGYTRAQAVADAVDDTLMQTRHSSAHAHTSCGLCRASSASRGESAQSSEHNMQKSTSDACQNGPARTTHPTHGPREQKPATATPPATPPPAARRPPRRPQPAVGMKIDVDRGEPESTGQPSQSGWAGEAQKSGAGMHIEA